MRLTSRRRNTDSAVPVTGSKSGEGSDGSRTPVSEEETVVDDSEKNGMSCPGVGGAHVR